MSKIKYSYKLIEEEHGQYSLLVMKDGSAMLFTMPEFIDLGKNVLAMCNQVMNKKEKGRTFLELLEERKNLFK